MKLFLLTAGLALAISSAAYAQSNSSTTTKPSAAGEKASATSASDEAVKATCKDGTPYSGKSLRGACRGHGGLDKEQNVKGNEKDTKSATKGESETTGSKTKTSSTAGAGTSAGATGGTGKVWANDESKVYHCSGDRYYGKTKKGEYMSEADAKQKGFRPDHGKACSS